MKQNKSQYLISIMGDSISTYRGYNPYDALVYYDAEMAYENGLADVHDTWWQSVIDNLSAALCVNNSYSGSCVAGVSEHSACSNYRCGNLHDNNQPDIILIYIGANDMGYKVEIGKDESDNTHKFYGAYRTMLSNLKNNYPNAKIICGTLLLCYAKTYEAIPASESYKRIVERYNGAIRAAVEAERCLLADLAAFGERFETEDGLHPNKNGHATMAKLWAECLNKLL